LDFYYGYDHYNVKSNYGYVRAVRGGHPTGFIDNGNGTITDIYTTLTWQQAPTNVMSWEAALSYCECLNLGSYTDWRLPTIKELRSLVDYNRYEPAIDTTFFPNTLMSLYWSSTTFTNSPDYAWGMSFDDAGDYYGYKGYGGYVRAVRGGLASIPGGQARLAASFVGKGLMVYDSFSAKWDQISLLNPMNMIYAGSTLYADFGVPFGLFKWNGTWTQLTPASPQNMVTSGSTLYVDVGANGLWEWNGVAWILQLTTADPENMVASSSTLYVDFGANGLWKWDVTWSPQLTPASPQNMVTSGSTLYGDFGTSGLWKWDGAAWNLLAQDPEKMVVSGSTLYADFVALGLWKWDGTVWSQLNSTNPENMVASGSTLYVDFGTAFGLWNWDGTSWFQLTALDPIMMAVSN
jgi:hypothetical protein